MQSDASKPAVRAQGLALPRRSAVAAMPSLTSTPRQGDAIATANSARPIRDRCWAEWFATRGCFRLNRQTYYPDTSGADSPVRPVSPVINARVQTGKIHLDAHLRSVSDTRYHRSSRHSYEDFMLPLARSPGQTIQTSLSVVGSNAACHWEALRLWLKRARLGPRPHTTFNPGLAIGKSRAYNSPQSSARANPGWSLQANSPG